MQHHENRALRLRGVGDMSTVGQYMDDQQQQQLTASTSPAQQQSAAQQQQQLHNNQQRLSHIARTPGASASAISSALASGPHADRSLARDYFDETGYIQRGILRSGEDPYVRNSFNQQASDALPSNRNIPDTRHQM